MNVRIDESIFKFIKSEASQDGRSIAKQLEQIIKEYKAQKYSLTNLKKK